MLPSGSLFNRPELNLNYEPFGLTEGVHYKETGELFESLSSQDLIKLKDQVVKFALDFADPFKTECPTEYLRMTIQHHLLNIKG